MAISTVHYRKTVFEHTNLSKIMGIPTYDTLHIFCNEIKSNTIAVHSNIGGQQHGYLGLVVRPTVYALLTNTPFVCQFHPGKIIVLIVATLQAQVELKIQYEKKPRVFHKIRGVE